MSSPASAHDLTAQTPLAMRRTSRDAGVSAARRRASRPAGHSPWTGADAVVLALVSATGGGGLVACWWGVSDEANWHHQLSWVAGGVLSVAVAYLGVGLWVYRGRRRVRQATAQVWSELKLRHTDRGDLFERWQAARTGAPVAGGPTVTAGWVSAPTMTRYHDASCALVRGKADVSRVSADDIAGRGLRECGACAQ